MTLLYPTNRQEVVDRVSTDVEAELPESDPFLPNSYLRALAIGYAGGIYDSYKTIQELQKQLFPDTATGEFADRWAAFKGIFRNPATQSLGLVTITGTAGTTLPINTLLQSGDGQQFSTQDIYIINTQSIGVTLTRSGAIVSATTVGFPNPSHYFATGDRITISGATETEYNGTFTIIVTSLTTFTYEITGTPSTPASGAILATLSFVSATVKSTGYGLITNLSSGSELFLASPVAGVDTSLFVQYEGLTGGSDSESDDDFRKRYLYVYQHPISYFNVAEIISKCQEINGVTRVFVEEITPDVGQVTIYFMRDNDTNPIPSGSQVATVRNHLLTIKPAHVDPADVIVKAPTPKVINFKFSVLDPDTATMQAAVLASLQAFFSEIPVVSENLSKNSYASAIFSTIDSATGASVKNFVLAYPLGDVLVSSGEIATLGTVTFP
jgi:uncharacterized phage protein gp47/JayE